MSKYLKWGLIGLGVVGAGVGVYYGYPKAKEFYEDYQEENRKREILFRKF